jgi:hypothetical protein
VEIGDRVDVGEFGLVFLRLSNRPLVVDSRPPGGRSAADASDSRETQPDASLVPYESPDESTVVTSPAEELALQSAPPSFGQAPASDEDRRLRELLAEEIARLGRERDDMHRHWEQSSAQLLAQIGQLHEEAARLASERQAFEQSRQQWQADQAAAADQLAKRSDQLAQR